MRLLAIILSVVVLSACGTTKVQRIDSSETIDLSGAWNDSDSRMTAQTMVADVLNRPWINRHVSQKGKPPTVIVGSIKNLTHEHINTNTFISDIERELINSGRVDFVASAQQRGEIRDERKDQDLNSTEASRNAAGQELGADYMLSGQINTIIDANASTQVRYYQVDLTLISLADNRKVWVGQEKIKKLVENAKIRY
ncbi:penicillin-binding protein activator LpoB [Colwellia psychrerythraea]|uniref:Putative conserved lipoprotein, UCP02722 n=1 Tax=Colwellia psychrerythraea TaxID=28229 RepID=A0A099KZ00_COLPS|nr:penicillin-binding protein activator LpoB [Colwellia psychrerythraea]KGJ95047.1 putative conserved lipoprotein, UCP02722 [Colwellia psychrerythraea]